METIRLDSWKSFREKLAVYASRSVETRAQWWFRGQADANWPLTTTLDRIYVFTDDEDRNQTIQRLASEFKEQLLHIADWTHELEGEALELFARHQGLPSPLLDWSQSPYVAAYFAFKGALEVKAEYAAVYGLNRTRLADPSAGVELLEDTSLLRFNRRALHQRGVFTRISTIQQKADDLLSSALFKFELPATEAPVALAELDEMTINSTLLLADVEAAAATAALRVRLRRMK